MLEMLQHICRVSLKSIIIIVIKEIKERRRRVISNKIEVIIQILAREQLIYTFNLLNHIQYHDYGAA
jgi:hypothetical protein